MRAKRLLLTLLIGTQLGIAGTAAQDAIDAAASMQAPVETIEALPTHPGLLQMLQQIEAQDMEISRLRGELEVQNHLLEQIKKRQRDLYTDLDRRLQRLEIPLTNPIETAPAEAEPTLQTLSPFSDREETSGAQQTETPLTLELIGREQTGGAIAEEAASAATPSEQRTEPVSAEPRSGTAADPAPAAVDPERIRAQFQNAYNLLESSRYDRSITAFREFQARYPDSEYADKVHFWLAEAYFINKRFAQALAEYQALLQNYPNSNKLVRAKLKVGFSLHELGLIESAKAQLEELIQQHPGTTAARLAQDRLKKIASITVPADMTPVN